MFSNVVLENPVHNSMWFDSVIPIKYVEVYEFNNLENKVLLKNGYAKSVVGDDSEWIRRLNSAKALKVEIVFTHYPLAKEDWITNYYELLSGRLKELFRIDPALNSPSIEWLLVKQTLCRNAEEAEALFHGISITYYPIQLSALKPIQPNPFLISYGDVSYNEITRPVFITSLVMAQPKEEDTSIQADLYPQSIYKRNIEHYLPPRVRRPNDPECPTFQTRMQKPKRSLWDRIFKP